MRLVHLFVGAAILLGLFSGAARSQTQTLYGVNIAGAGRMITISTVTGAGSVAGPLAPGLTPWGIGLRGASLYTFDGLTPPGLIHQLNFTGGTVTTINVGTGIFPNSEGDIAFRSDGIGFISNSIQLISFDITVPNSKVVGPLNPWMDGLAFNGAGVLFGLKQGGDALYTIDQNTGVATLVGNTGIAGAVGTPIAGLSFDSSGKLFAAVALSVGGPSSLYQINPTTGVATLVGPIGFNDVSGLVFGPLAGVTVTESAGSTTVTEGGPTDTCTVVLNSPPVANVTITINPATQVTVAPATLTFTPANWNVAQTVTVTAIDDAVYEGLHTGNIMHTATSLDPAYNGITIVSVIANITDNDPPPPPSGGEGSYPGSGSFGFGGGRSTRYRASILHGPLNDGSASRVRNVSHAQATAASTDTGFGPLGWSLVLALGIGVILVIKKTGYA